MVYTNCYAVTASFTQVVMNVTNCYIVIILCLPTLPSTKYEKIVIEKKSAENYSKTRFCYILFLNMFTTLRYMCFMFMFRVGARYRTELQNDSVVVIHTRALLWFYVGRLRGCKSKDRSFSTRKKSLINQNEKIQYFNWHKFWGLIF